MDRTISKSRKINSIDKTTDKELNKELKISDIKKRVHRIEYALRYANDKKISIDDFSNSDALLFNAKIPKSMIIMGNIDIDNINEINVTGAQTIKGLKSWKSKISFVSDSTNISIPIRSINKFSIVPHNSKVISIDLKNDKSFYH